MLNKKTGTFLVILLVTVLPKLSNAQEIIGDTIFVSTEQPSILYFPQTVTFCEYDSANSHASFEKAVEKNLVSIKTKAEDAESTILEVKEGSRDHLFILVYKKNMSQTDYVHDWDNMDKLKNYVDQSFSKKGLNPAFPESDVATSSSSKKRANRYRKKSGEYWQNKYAAIKIIADSLQNQTTSAKKQQLASSKNTMSKEAPVSISPDEDSLNENELPTPYDSIISLAAGSLNEPPYEKALDLYKQANTLKPLESYPPKMIKYVESLIADYQEKIKRQQDLERKAQIVYMTSKANKALEEKKLDSAKVWLTEVVALNPTKTQGEYAQKKVEAIDIQLQKMANAPVKEEPKPAVHLTARQRRLKRQADKRNAILSGNYKKDQPKN